jgi:putative addiction module component (TIGR02574 family)
MPRPTLDELRALSVEDRLQLLEDVWTSLDEEQDRLPIPKWHEEELDRRMKAFEENPNTGSPWQDVKKRLLERR